MSEFPALGFGGCIAPNSSKKWQNWAGKHVYFFSGASWKESQLFEM